MSWKKKSLAALFAAMMTLGAACADDGVEENEGSDISGETGDVLEEGGELGEEIGQGAENAADDAEDALDDAVDDVPESEQSPE